MHAYYASAQNGQLLPEEPYNYTHVHKNGRLLCNEQVMLYVTIV